MTRSATALLTLLALLAALLSIMTWAARRTHNAADFAIANRRLGPWLVTLSYAATGVNAWMLMTVAAAAFLWGVSAAWIWAAVVFGCVVNMWFVAPRLRAASIGSGGVTVIHLLSADAGDRLQPLVVRSAVLIMMVTLLLQIAAILHFAGAMLADVGLSTTNVLLLSLTVLTATVFAGGLRAASVIDTIQSVVLIAVALFLPLPALIATGGLTELRMAFMTIGPEATDWFGGKNGVAAIAFAAGVVGLGLAMCGQPHALARFMAAKDEATLRIARWVAPVWIAILLAAVVFCGWCARVLYSGLENPEQSLAVIASRLLPPWLATLIVVGLAAAVISAIASQLLVLASGFAIDLKRPTTPPVAAVAARHAAGHCSPRMPRAALCAERASSSTRCSRSPRSARRSVRCCWSASAANAFVRARRSARCGQVSSCRWCSTCCPIRRAISSSACCRSSPRSASRSPAASVGVIRIAPIARRRRCTTGCRSEEEGKEVGRRSRQRAKRATAAGDSQSVPEIDSRSGAAHSARQGLHLRQRRRSRGIAAACAARGHGAAADAGGARVALVSRHQCGRSHFLSGRQRRVRAAAT